MGNWKNNFNQSFFELNKLGIINNCSSIYLSKPYGFKNQNFFYNVAIELYTNINPNELIAKLQLIEKRLKKNKLISNGPRRIDLDIIYYNKFVIRKDSLIIPHPRAHLRDFVLYPICEIIPFYIHPIIKKTTKHLISQLKKKYIFKIIKKQKGSELIF
ncbi:MAG: Bifunctional folate synthesis protein [Alphaproteobacteria bacterium MarineAlpha5_Bin8]|nr:MAG: Bifunctional folate synthesis protein [Alphaproteobacteria bacterium MarineAlpha5_Bin7]PPR45826.1 MAG: Bifunctional folate synthesis protein [Alphaproteobacteria bacterium MarineAlpha5_Bin8]PPR54601.1 MAG: Bifunctional folate synthesis protein [Alphaproteobacteria bacterium MarineAlpha5_Bin6]|tara:strand:- start:193 stop:666 length:474 start_codon:yes stop_codon:yes gene_type:complete